MEPEWCTIATFGCLPPADRNPRFKAPNCGEHVSKCGAVAWVLLPQLPSWPSDRAAADAQKAKQHLSQLRMLPPLRHRNQSPSSSPFTAVVMVTGGRGGPWDERTPLPFHPLPARPDLLTPKLREITGGQRLRDGPTGTHIDFPINHRVSPALTAACNAPPPPSPPGASHGADKESEIRCGQRWFLKKKTGGGREHLRALCNGIAWRSTQSHNSGSDGISVVGDVAALKRSQKGDQKRRSDALIFNIKHG